MEHKSPALHCTAGRFFTLYPGPQRNENINLKGHSDLSPWKPSVDLVHFCILNSSTDAHNKYPWWTGGHQYPKVITFCCYILWTGDLCMQNSTRAVIWGLQEISDISFHQNVPTHYHLNNHSEDGVIRSSTTGVRPHNQPSLGWDLALALQPCMSGQYPLIGSTSPSVLHIIASNLIASVLAILLFYVVLIPGSFGTIQHRWLFLKLYHVFPQSKYTLLSVLKKESCASNYHTSYGPALTLAGNSILASSAQEGEQFCCSVLCCCCYSKIQELFSISLPYVGMQESSTKIQGNVFYSDRSTGQSTLETSNSNEFITVSVRRRAWISPSQPVICSWQYLRFGK